MTIPTVYIVIVNWNGWLDTIECLESLLRNNYASYRIIVCDNDSDDDSREKLSACSTTWASNLPGKRFLSLRKRYSTGSGRSPT